jgi:two-component system response regulator PilR (NtrC family)
MNVWVVDDEKNLAEGLASGLTKRGFNVTVCGCLAELKGLLAESDPEIVFLDVRLPDGDGLQAIPAVLQRSPGAKIIIMTAYGDSSLIVKAIKEGAYNYLDKPFPLEAAANMAIRAKETLELSRKVIRLEQGRKVQLVGSSQAMMKVRDFVEKVSKYKNVNVLLKGESGTGKEVIARLIAEQSEAHKGEFVAVNCAAIPESLLEAELFGYRKGAYTGATTSSEGLILMADGGTLLLDEIGDMPLPLQQKLLRFLDTRTIRPLGSQKEKEVTTNIICATCVDLEERINSGAFRDDLYYRISTLPLEVPPLRKRGKDVLELTHWFLADYSKRHGRPPLEPDEEVEQVFLRHPWPGNVRELKNLVERLYILKDQEDRIIRAADLPQDMLDALPVEGIADGGETMPLQQQLAQVEEDLINRALSRTGGNKSEASRVLGISRYALLRRMQRYGMDADE